MMSVQRSLVKEQRERRKLASILGGNAFSRILADRPNSSRQNNIL